MKKTGEERYTTRWWEWNIDDERGKLGRGGNSKKDSEKRGKGGESSKIEEDARCDRHFRDR